MTATKLRLQLDGSALERLLGGDTEAEIELRECIANEFAKRHLRELANSEKMKRFMEDEASALRTETDKLIEKHIGKRKGYSHTFELNPDVKLQIEKHIKVNIDQSIQKTLATIQEKIETKSQEAFEKLLPNLDLIIEKRISMLTDAYIIEQTQRRLMEISRGLVAA